MKQAFKAGSRMGQKGPAQSVSGKHVFLTNGLAYKVFGIKNTG
jgi:hypothetical protein